MLGKKANNWVIRNFYEAKNNEKKCFITLTYAKTPIFLVRKDFQDWLKDSVLKSIKNITIIYAF